MANSGVINLGEAELDLAVRLYRLDTAGPEALDASGVDVEELGDGDYYLTGLPDPGAGPAGGFQVIVVLATAPVAALATYSYGGRSSTTVPALSRIEVEIPRVPTTMVQYDTYGALSLVVRKGLPAEIGDAGTTSTCQMSCAGAVVFADRDATIASVVEAADGSYGATLLCAFEPGDRDQIGQYSYEFEIHFVGGLGKLTLPQSRPATFMVRADLNGE